MGRDAGSDEAKSCSVGADTRVVKALNALNANVMVNPGMVPGEHDLFMWGNDPTAKAAVPRYLRD